MPDQATKRRVTQHHVDQLAESDQRNLLRAAQDVVSAWKRWTDEPGWDNCEWDGFAYALGDLENAIEIPEKAP
jgi:hypothetical protein